MGWWTKKSSKWEACIVAQVGGAAVLGGGAFFLQFRSPDIAVKPAYLALAGGAGVGGSVGSAVSIPWSDLVRSLINPKFRAPTDSYGWSALEGTFSCADIQLEQFEIAQAGASAVIVGAQVASFTITEVHMFSPSRKLCTTQITVPKNLPQFGKAMLDLPQVQGGLGAGAFAFMGTLFYLG